MAKPRTMAGIIPALLASSHLLRTSAAFSLRPAAAVPLLPRNVRPTAISLLSSNDDAGTDSSAEFLSSLRTRISEVSDSEKKLPLVVLDSMLPRQVLRLEFNNGALIELVRTRLERENPHFGVLGVARLADGRRVHLRTGVEVEIIDPEFAKGGGGGVKLELRAKRRFVIDGDVENAPKGWTEARVRFLDSATEEEEEVRNGSDRFAVARAMAKARSFTDRPPDASDGSESDDDDDAASSSLVDRWIDLARKNEREKGQIDRLLDELGEMPPPEEPSERSFWIGALINPIPAMGVATEVRPALLTAKTAERRVEVALESLTKSIGHMDGSAKLF